MNILNTIIEIITCPFSFLMRANITNPNSTKWGKPLIILAMALVVVILLILFFYRNYIFK